MPAHASITAPTCEPLRRSDPISATSTSVKMGPHATMSALEKALDR